jgi:hypothetical protein
MPLPAPWTRQAVGECGSLDQYWSVATLSAVAKVILPAAALPVCRVHDVPVAAAPCPRSFLQLPPATSPPMVPQDTTGTAVQPASTVSSAGPPQTAAQDGSQAEVPSNQVIGSQKGILKRQRRKSSDASQVSAEGGEVISKQVKVLLESMRG